MPESVRHPSSKKKSGNRFVVLALGLILGVTFFALWQAGSWLGGKKSKHTAPIRILSGSMAPALHGPAWQMRCDDCDESFLCDSASAESSGPSQPFPEYAVCCPNCGKHQRLATRKNSQRVEQQVDVVSIPRDREIGRYEIVAIKEANTDQFAVKRILGLPGETISIRDGDVFVDGKILRKDLEQLRQVAIPVHRHRRNADQRKATGDEEHRPRWQSGMLSDWVPEETGFSWQDSDGENEGAVDWLQYYHSPSLPMPFQRGTPGPIKDGYGYNQELSRSLNDVSDFFVRFDASPGDCSALWLKLNHRAQSFTCCVTPDDATLVVGSAANADPQVFPMPVMKNTSAASRFAEFVWGYWDGQIVLVVDGKEVFRHAAGLASTSDSQVKFSGHVQPLAIGIEPAPPPRPLKGDKTSGQGGASTVRVEIPGIRALEIYRDVFYTNPSPGKNGGAEWQAPRLEAGGYFLLGDNSPLSVDSRHDSDVGRQLRKRLLGRVVNPSTASPSPTTVGTTPQSARPDP